MLSKMHATPKLGRPSKASAKPLTPEEYAKAGTEHAHQVALFMWFAQRNPRLPWSDLLFAIPNGGLRNPVTASRLKAEGVKRGVPDICLPIARRGLHGLFIEMKRPADAPKDFAKGRVADVQTIWHERLQLNGYATFVCYGWEQALDWILRYME